MARLSLFILFSLASAAQGHPGVGIVQDSRGNIYYTDLKQVWMIAPDGRMSVAVPNVHTHELYVNADDNLFGEHLSYDGSRTQKWMHRVWKRAKDGRVTDVISEGEGFLTDYSFVRDSKGNMYFVVRDQETVIKKRSPDGRIVNHGVGKFRNLSWLTVTSGGELFVIDSGDLRKVSPSGVVTTVVAKLSSIKPAPASVSDLNYHMGLWTDPSGCVYVAVGRERLVIKVKPDGTTTIADRSEGKWSPSGGFFDRAGTMWILEYSETNEIRVRHKLKDGGDKVFGPGG